MWQPISTAPRDGTYIVVYEPGRMGSPPNVRVARWAHSPWGAIHDEYFEDWIGVEAGLSPSARHLSRATHWMPLPDERG